MPYPDFAVAGDSVLEETSSGFENTAKALIGLRAEVYARLGETYPGDFWPAATVDRQLNEALKRFSLEHEWSWLTTYKSGITVAANQQTMDLEPDVAVSRNFNIMLTRTGETNPRKPLKRVQPHVGFKMRSHFTTKATPEFFYLESSAVADQDPGSATRYQMVWKVRFVPIPDVSHTAEYQYLRRPRKLYYATDTPDVPGDYDEAVIAWATATCWLMELHGASKAQEQFAIYEKVVDQARRDDMGVVQDELLIWGGEEPEYRPDDGIWNIWWRLPDKLGP